MRRIFPQTTSLCQCRQPVKTVGHLHSIVYLFCNVYVDNINYKGIHVCSVQLSYNAPFNFDSPFGSSNVSFHNQYFVPAIDPECPHYEYNCNDTLLDYFFGLKSL